MDNIKIFPRLKEIILEKSYKEGIFLLSSGGTTSFYIDCKPTILDPEGISLVAIAFLQIIYQSDQHIDAIAGVELGAVPLVTGVSLLNYIVHGILLPGLIVRKKIKAHGTKHGIEGIENVPTGSSIVLLEDVITTAKTVIEAIARLEKAGYHVSYVVAIVDRQEGGRETLVKAGYDLRTIFTREELLS